MWQKAKHWCGEHVNAASVFVALSIAKPQASSFIKISCFRTWTAQHALDSCLPITQSYLLLCNVAKTQTQRHGVQGSYAKASAELRCHYNNRVLRSTMAMLTFPCWLGNVRWKVVNHRVPLYLLLMCLSCTWQCVFFSSGKTSFLFPPLPRTALSHILQKKCSCASLILWCDSFMPCSMDNIIWHSQIRICFIRHTCEQLNKQFDYVLDTSLLIKGP